MNRRSFIKRGASLLGLLYMSPIGYIKEAIDNNPIKNHVMSFEGLNLDHYAEYYIKPAMQALADKIDKDIMTCCFENQ